MRNNVTGKVVWWVHLLAIALISLQLFIAYQFAAALISQPTMFSSLFAENLPDALILVFLNVLLAFVAATCRSPDKVFPVASLNLRQLLRRSH